MKKFKILKYILKTTGMWSMLISFIVFLMGAAAVILMVEPDINSYWDSLWFLFASFTTIGYGDYTAVTLVGRVAVVVTSLYGILLVSFVPAVIVNYYTEVTKLRYHDSVLEFFDKLENLPNLSKEELEEISKTVKSNRWK